MLYWESYQREALICAVNPATGREGIIVLNQRKEEKGVRCGRGPAVMEAARVAALRGHRVTLWEKGDSLGRPCSGTSVRFRKDLAATADWFKRELDVLDLEIRTGVEINAHPQETNLK